MVQGTSLRVIWVANLLHFFATGIVRPINPALLNSRGLTPLEIGVIASVGSFITIFLPVGAGLISDLIGRKPIILISAVFGTLSSLLFPFSVGFLSLLALYVASSASFSVIMPLVVTWAVDETGSDDVGASIGRLGISNSSGWLLGALAGGILQEAFGYPIPYLISTAAMITVGVLLVVVPEAPRKGRDTPLRLSLLLNRRFAGVLAIEFLVMVTFPAYMTFLPVYMHRELNATPTLRSLAFSLATGSEIPVLLYLGKRSDRLGRRKIFSLSLLAFVTRWFLTSAFSDPILVSVSQVLHGFAWASLYVASFSYISEIITVDLRGSAIGLKSASTSVAVMMGSYMFGYLAENWGFKTMFLVSAILPVTAFLFLPTINSKPHDASP